jgi:capsular exopolysaccharide synthesis family protein
MSRIGEALKRAGLPDASVGHGDLQAGATVVDADPASGILIAEPPVAAADVIRPPEPAIEQAAVPEPSNNGHFDTATTAAIEKLVANPDLAPFAVEQYRRLAAILHHTQEARGIKKVLIASALAEEGKTLTTVNLALTLSQSYARRVLLIDADLRRPSVNHVFGLPNTSGLTEALSSPAPGKLGVLQVSEYLSVLPAGQPTSDPMAGLTSPRMSQILQEAADTFDWVVIDSPPVGVLTDAKLLAAMADGCLLVVAAGRTPFDSIRRAAEALGRDRLLGVVLNRVSHKHLSPGEYYQYEYQYYGADRRSSSKAGWLSRILRRA